MDILKYLGGCLLFLLLIVVSSAEETKCGDQACKVNWFCDRTRTDKPMCQQCDHFLPYCFSKFMPPNCTDLCLENREKMVESRVRKEEEEKYNTMLNNFTQAMNITKDRIREYEINTTKLKDDNAKLRRDKNREKKVMNITKDRIREYEINITQLKDDNAKLRRDSKDNLEYYENTSSMRLIVAVCLGVCVVALIIALIVIIVYNFQLSQANKHAGDAVKQPLVNGTQPNEVGVNAHVQYGIPAQDVQDTLPPQSCNENILLQQDPEHEAYDGLY